MARISLNSEESIGSTQHVDDFEWDTTGLNSHISIWEKKFRQEPAGTADCMVTVLSNVNKN